MFTLRTQVAGLYSGVLHGEHVALLHSLIGKHY